MTSGDNMRTGGQLVVDALTAHGAEQVFCVPGESYLAVLDALYDADGLAVTVCRQEGGAAMMADAYGKLTGRPGICMVTRGPGATNASPGIHIAFQDSTPLILFVGQVARGMIEREAFQEIDYRRMFGQMAKWVAQIDSAERVPEFVGRAFHTATAGRPGPVVLALPEDMLLDRAPGVELAPYTRTDAHPSPAAMMRLEDMLAAARRPLMVLGGGGWNATACADVRAFAEAFDLPVAASFRCMDYFDNTHPNYAGDLGYVANPKLAERVRAADLLLVVGDRLGEVTSASYSLLAVPRPSQALVHVHPGAEELGRVYQPELSIHASIPGFAAAAAGLNPVREPPWRDERTAAHDDYLGWIRPTTAPGGVQLAEIVAWLSETLPADAIVCNGAGNYAGWVNRFYRYRDYRTLLGPTSGSMGYGTPAAVAAKRVHPERMVVAFAGDGCFMMNGQELATAVQYGLAIIVIVVNNGMYGTIRAHQEREYPGRVSASSLTNPDFAKLAEAYGAHGEAVTRTEDFAAAFARAAEAGRPALIELRIDPEGIAPGRTLSEIRAAAEARQGG
ncbi:MAG: thiamine pyrophosphate-binding protein [Alphaproteobacteria bacterium]|nr:thiamine pyrophosphate-binding protein [Alphaproteobacteria bacterium]